MKRAAERDKILRPKGRSIALKSGRLRAFMHSGLKRPEYPAAFVMNRYAKGAGFERRIVSDFWRHGWASMRAAGSGTTSFPSPDVIGAKDGRLILIECKATRKDRLSLKKDVLELKEFSDICGAEACIAIKFHKKEPRFYRISDILRKGNYTISMSDPFLSFDSLLSEQRLL